MTKPLLLAAIATALLFASTTEACGAKSCDVACENRVTAKRSVSFTDASIEGARGTACRDEACVNFEVVAHTSSSLFCFSGSNEGGGDVFCEISVLADGTLELEFEYSFQSPDDGAPRDGDAYVFDLFSPVDPSQSLVHVEGKAHYEPSETCGEECLEAEI